MASVSEAEPRSSIIDPSARWLTALRSTPILASVLLILSWRVPVDLFARDLDQSWQVGLDLAFERGIHFGSGFVFTYGPLGFTTITPPWLGPVSIPGIVVAGLVQLALSWIVLAGARRLLPLPAALVVAFVAARAFALFQVPEALFALALGAAVRWLTREPSAPIEDGPAPPTNAASSGRSIAATLIVPIAAGLMAGLALLTKVSDGLFIVIVLGIAVAAEPRRRGWGGVLRAGISFVIAVLIGLLAGWLLTGQVLSELPAYARGSYEIIRGYSAAMNVPLGIRGPYLVAIAAGAVVIGWWLWPALRRMDRLQRSGLIGIGAVTLFVLFKIDVVKEGPVEPLSILLVCAFVVAHRELRRFAFVGGVAVILVPLLLAEGGRLGLLAPGPSVSALVSQAATVLRPWTWSTQADATQAKLQQQYPLGPTILGALDSHTAFADPWSAGAFAAWPQLVWQPLPVIQSYTAYTSALDALNASVLEGPDAPERILRRSRGGVPGSAFPGLPTINGRDGWFEAPAAMLQTFCRYDEIAATPAWEVLGLTTRRCGTPQIVETVTGTTGETIAVPPAPSLNDFLVVRITGLETLVDSVQTTLYQAPRWQITLGGRATYRLVPGTAGDGLLMAVPQSVVRSPAFAFGPPTISLSIQRSDGRPADLAFEFVAIPLVGGSAG